MPHLALIAQSPTTTSTLEWEWPYLAIDWVPIVLLGLALIATLWFTFRDTRQLSRGWTIFLLLMRIGVLTAALVIAFNPHVRTQTNSYRPSKVILLVDTSTSMQQSASDPRTDPEVAPTARSEAVTQLFSESSLIDSLQAQHTVDLYTFDGDLSELQLRLPSRYQPADGGSSVANSDPSGAPVVEWETLFSSSGHTTSLGDSVDKLLVEAKSPSLSGIVVISDGASNSGRDVTSPRNRAQTEGVRLVAIGVGSTTPPVNLEMAKLIAPTDVQKGDAFELSALVTGQGVAGQTVELDLLQKGPNDPEPAVIHSETAVLPEQGLMEFNFDLQPASAGEYEYTVRASLEGAVETRTEDNELSRSVSIFDRPLRVLVIAGGPMRDYRFAKTALYRHPSVETELWLQTGSVGISQEADRLLFRFPEQKEEMYGYDVVLAFDPDWSLLDAEQLRLISDWIANEGGGLIAVAGDIFTPDLATNVDLEVIRRLYPVLLDEVGLSLGARDRAETPYRLGFTQEGQLAEFLDLAESGEDSAWMEFPGVYRCYPTRGSKAGATIYAEFTDPLARGPGGQPILVAGHRFGQGQVLYLGSPEIWRLRALQSAYVDRFWIKSVRKAAEGRSKRGLQRALFVLDAREFELGQEIPLRLRALNPQFEPLVADSLRLDLFGPNGSPILPGPELLRDSIRPSEYIGGFRPLRPGRYRLEFAVPESSERVILPLDVRLPRQEAASLTQDEKTLKRLTEGTGGEYVTLADAATTIPDLLPNKGESIVIDQQIQEVWDRRWVMFLLAFLLSLEWLIRKLMKLA